MSAGWAFIRPADQTLLERRPLLDLGVGDGQTLAAVSGSEGLVVGVDRRFDLLPRLHASGLRVAQADAVRLPFRDVTFATVLAADLFHHLDDEALRTAAGEISRVLTPGGRLVGWWYTEPRRPAPDAPRFPRRYAEVAAVLDGFTSVQLELEVPLDLSPPTTGVAATR